MQVPRGHDLAWRGKEASLLRFSLAREPGARGPVLRAGGATGSSSGSTP